MSVPSNRLGPGVPDAGVALRVQELHAAHAPAVRAICRSMLRDRLEAEDAEQQTFLSAHRALANGSRPEDAAAWLAVIARNECLARIRGRMREPLPVEEPDTLAAPDAHEAAVRRAHVGELRDALAELPAQQRDALLLREVRGLSYEEVAASLAVTTSAVESLLFRARRRLQTRLREALAGVFPAGWGEAVRELAVRLAGSGLGAPAAAKAVAVGVGTAVVTGGAVLATPHLLAHAPSRHALSIHARPRHAHTVRRPPIAVAPAAPVGVWTPVAQHPAPTPTSVATRKRTTEAHDSSGSERERSDGGTQATGTGTQATAERSDRTSSAATSAASDGAESSGAGSGSDSAGSSGDSTQAPTATTPSSSSQDGTAGSDGGTSGSDGGAAGTDD